MCNTYRNRITLQAYREAFADLQTPTGAPNLEPRDSIRITEPAPIIRLDGEGRPELVQVRWSWPGPGGKPVYNFRSEGRRFAQGRCLIPADGFYEFTDPEPPAPKRAKKVRWLFTMAAKPWFCIAGLYRPQAADGADAFTMLTAEPGLRRGALPPTPGRRAGAGRLVRLAWRRNSGACAGSLSRRHAAGGAQRLTSGGADQPARWERQAGVLTLVYRAAIVVLLILILVEARAAHRDAAVGALDAAEVRAEMIREMQPRRP